MCGYSSIIAAHVTHKTRALIGGVFIAEMRTPEKIALTVADIIFTQAHEGAFVFDMVHDHADTVGFKPSLLFHQH